MLLGYNKQGWLLLKIFKQGLPFLFHLCRCTDSFHVIMTTGLLLSGRLLSWSRLRVSFPFSLAPESPAVPPSDWPQATTPWLPEAWVLFRFFLFIKTKKHIILSLGLFWRINKAVCVKVLWKPYGVMKTQDHPCGPWCQLQIKAMVLRNVSCKLQRRVGLQPNYLEKQQTML